MVIFIIFALLITKKIKMTIKEFHNLSEAEVALMNKMPALVTLLIAGADDKVDDEEKKWAAAVVNYRRITGEELLFDYYENVEDSFEMQLLDMIKEYPQGHEERTKILVEEIASVNSVLPKINEKYAHTLVNSWQSLAKQVAKASGGFLGFNTVSKQEEEFLGLDMIKF